MPFNTCLSNDSGKPFQPASESPLRPQNTMKSLTQASWIRPAVSPQVEVNSPVGKIQFGSESWGTMGFSMITFGNLDRSQNSAQRYLQNSKSFECLAWSMREARSKSDRLLYLQTYAKWSRPVDGNRKIQEKIHLS
jgi:hypothetical protein